MPALIQILEGQARLTLGADTRDAGPGAFVHMPPQLEHGIFATTPVIMLLLMMKQPRTI
jgi:quercetin dioxygenase-like cupin family protein